MNKFLKLRSLPGRRFLADHKLLALSAALNVLLAVAGAMLLCQVCPQFLYRLESVSNWGRYSVRTYRDYDSAAAYLEVLVGPTEDRKGPKVPRRI